MQRLGPVLHITPSGNIITKTENPPKIGETVIDENLKPVGKVFDIIGPVPSPYLVIRPVIKVVNEKITNKILYVNPSSRRKEKIKR